GGAGPPRRRRQRASRLAAGPGAGRGRRGLLEPAPGRGGRARPHPGGPGSARMSVRSARFDPLREPAPLWLARRLAAGLLRLIFRLRITGVEHLPRSGPVLLAGNHTGFLDGPVVFILLPRPAMFLVKSELYTGPWARVLAFARQIPIRRGTPDRTALFRPLAVLDGGGVLGVFPEGTRGEGKLETIQHGIGYLALRAGCPIVPVLCRGTAAALP